MLIFDTIQVALGGTGTPHLPATAGPDLNFLKPAPKANKPKTVLLMIVVRFLIGAYRRIVAAERQINMFLGTSKFTISVPSAGRLSVGLFVGETQPVLGKRKRAVTQVEGMRWNRAEKSSWQTSR